MATITGHTSTLFTPTTNLDFDSDDNIDESDYDPFTGRSENL